VLSAQDLPPENALQARKLFFQAEQMAKNGAPAQAVVLYQKAFPIWKKALEKYPEFRRDLDNQERTYELEMNYLQQLEELRGSLVKKLLIIPDALAQGTGPAPQIPLWLASPMRLDRRLPAPFAMPFDPEENKPRWIAADVVLRVRKAKKLPGMPSEMVQAGGANIPGRPDIMMQQMGMGAPGGGR